MPLNMKDFIVQYILHGKLLNGNDFMNLSNTCKSFRLYNTSERLSTLWNHGKVKNIKTALYVESKLKQYLPGQILAEAPNRIKEREVVSALRKLISPEAMMRLSWSSTSKELFLLERIRPVKSILGKRSKMYT